MTLSETRLGGFGGSAIADHKSSNAYSSGGEAEDLPDRKPEGGDDAFSVKFKHESCTSVKQKIGEEHAPRPEAFSGIRPCGDQAQDYENQHKRERFE